MFVLGGERIGDLMGSLKIVVCWGDAVWHVLFKLESDEVTTSLIDIK